MLTSLPSASLMSNGRYSFTRSRSLSHFFFAAQIREDEEAHKDWKFLLDTVIYDEFIVNTARQKMWPLEDEPLVRAAWEQQFSAPTLPSLMENRVLRKDIEIPNPMFDPNQYTNPNDFVNRHYRKVDIEASQQLLTKIAENAFRENDY